MADNVDNTKWEDYHKRCSILYQYGLEKGLIHPFENELIENLRHVYYGGVPASILLLLRDFCDGFCHDRAFLLSFGVGQDDFRLVTADIDGLVLNPRYAGSTDSNYGNHRFLERTKCDGSKWVYDTSTGLVYAKDLYYKMERPKVIKVKDKKAILANDGYREIMQSDIQNDKYALPAILPFIENIAMSDTSIYHDRVLEEIARFKQEIGYDDICRELAESMQNEGLDAGFFSLFENKKSNQL